MVRPIWLVMLALALAMPALLRSAEPNEQGEAIAKALAWINAKDASGELTNRAAGLAVGPDLLLVPLQSIVLADSLSARAPCCDEQPAAGIVAFDAVAGLALVRVPDLKSAVWHDIAPLPEPMPERLALFWRPPVEREGQVATASSEHRVLQVFDAGFRGQRLRLDHNFTMGTGDVLVNEAGDIIAMTTEWAGNDRVYAVPVAGFLEKHLPLESASPFPPRELLDRAGGDLQRSALLTIRAQALRRQAPPDELVPLVEEAVELAPQNAGAWYLLGVKLDEAGRKAQGLAALQKAVDLEPAWGEPWYSLGLVHLTSQQPVEAQRALRRAVEADEAHADAQAMLGVSLLYQGRFEEALVPMDRACELIPERLLFAQNYQLALIRARGEREAYKAWPRYIEAVPDDRRAHVQYLYTLIQAEQLETLEKQAARGIEQFGENAEDLALHAYASLNLGRDPDVVRDLANRTLAVDPQNAIALNVLSDLP